MGFGGVIIARMVDAGGQCACDPLRAASVPAIELSLGFSPDADDVAMWWPLLGDPAAGAIINAHPYRFRPVREDIESLNRRSLAGELDVTAMSCAQFAFVAETYAITSCGVSMGDRFGPKLVSRPGVTLDDVRAGQAVVAVPGERTTAFAALRVLLAPDEVAFVTAPFDEIITMVERGDVPAGLLIHETQLSFQRRGLVALADVAQLWGKRFGLPLPLGINTIRKDLDDRFGEGTTSRVTALLTESVRCAMTRRRDSLAVARRVSGALLNDAALEEYLARYVNAWTLSLGAVGRLAVRRLLTEMARIGLAPSPASIDFVDPAGERC